VTASVPLILGVDGGNTKTIAIVSRLDGSIVGVARGGCSDMYGVGTLEAAVEVIVDVCDRALAMADARREDVVAAGFSLAGADWQEDHADLSAALTHAGLSPRCTVVNDGLGALRGGSPDGLGVAVVCGTGLAIGSRACSGATWHGGFWLDDHGGETLGEAVVRAVRRAELSIDPPTSLTSEVLRCFGQPDVESVLHLLTGRTRPVPPRLSRLSVILLDEAERGDEVARSILREHGKGISDFAVTAAIRVGLGDESFPLVLTGGVFRHPSPFLRDSVVHRVRGVLPGAQPMAARYEPAIGALLLGFDSLALELSEERRMALEKSMPVATMFSTHDLPEVASTVL
jgi:N-acetylglucosamine kinase-like BadF-type ATPase